MYINPDHAKAMYQEYERQLAFRQLLRELRKAKQRAAKPSSKPANRFVRLMMRLAAVLRRKADTSASGPSVVSLSSGK